MFVLWDHYKLKIFGVDINVGVVISKWKFEFMIWFRGKKQREKDLEFDRGY